MIWPSTPCGTFDFDTDLPEVKQENVERQVGEAEEAGEAGEGEKHTEKEENGKKDGAKRPQNISVSKKKRTLDKMFSRASKKKRSLKKKLLEASLKRRALKKMLLEESKKEAKDSGMASVVGESIPAQETFTNRKRPCVGLELTSDSKTTSSPSLINLKHMETEVQADISFPTEESLLVPDSSSSVETINTLQSRMPSIRCQTGSSQQKCPETSGSSHSSSRGKSHFLCDECGKLFKESLTHRRKIHRGGFKCSVCGNIHMMGPKK